MGEILTSIHGRKLGLDKFGNLVVLGSVIPGGGVRCSAGLGWAVATNANGPERMLIGPLFAMWT